MIMLINVDFIYVSGIRDSKMMCYALILLNEN